ncbi:MAG: hypothetical protein E7433_05470 [Ruminococcaceae bacterium]|nr:hypothetical protein [Oscillospiraceae bacterium]
MQLFNCEECVDILCKNQNPYVLLAVEDLIRDFSRVSTSGLRPKLVTGVTEDCIIIEDNELSSADAILDESFSVIAEDEHIVIRARGYLGTMWGIYTFSEQILGIDPCYLFNDLAIQPRESLSVSKVDIQRKPPVFGFRGVFINDEDLLTGWRNGGGIRYIDVPCYGVTVEPDVMDMVVETVLRLRLNLVIPATFLDIENPAEKQLADCVARRGIYLSQHHVETSCVSSFAFKSYCKKNGIHGEFSFAKCPELMETVWKHYIGKWAQYDNVVWQIGLRGPGDDRPLWQDDVPTEQVLKESGALVGGALAKQKSLIMEATEGKARFFTSTLWMEGSRLMAEGYLLVPRDTIVVFADNGPCQMYGPDFENVPRVNTQKYGIYYHLQYFGCGPHLIPMTGLDKLYYNIRRAYDKGDTDYIILNASNMREFVLELGAYSQMLWDPVNFSEEAFLQQHTADIYGEWADQAEQLIKRYYDSIPELDSKIFANHLQKYFNYDFRTDYGKIKNFTAKDGIVLEYGTAMLSNFHRQLGSQECTDPFYKEFNEACCDEMYRAVEAAIKEFDTLIEDFKALADAVSEPLKTYIRVRWINHTGMILYLYQWYANLYEARVFCAKMEAEQFRHSVEKACESLENLLAHRKCAEYGIFKNWYRGDLKMNVKQRLYDTRSLLCQTPFE